MYHGAMEWINYQHLLYFWVVAKEGTISAACEKLHLAQPTISAQLRVLEKALGEKLFRRVGRNLVLTEIGHVVYRYANEIFPLGQELLDTLRGRPTGAPVRFTVGVADVVPKLVAYRLLEPATRLQDPVCLRCHEGTPAELLAKLSIHELDLVLSDRPVGPEIRVKAYSHLLGQCGVSIFGTKELAAAHRTRFPRSLDGAPFLLPTDNTALRRSLDRWFESEDIRPSVAGEFADGALLKVFGQAGIGMFPVETVIENEVGEQYGVELVGRVDSVQERFYAISVERKIKHPAVIAITQAAREEIFT